MHRREVCEQHPRRVQHARGRRAPARIKRRGDGERASRRAAPGVHGMRAVGEGDVCPLPELDYVAFANESGSISKMAVVRRELPRALGRYLLGEPIAAGGMAEVHLGRIVGPAGFSRTVAIKRMHAVLAGRPDLVGRFVDEAKISARVRHANVVRTLDAVSIDGEVLLVLEYVHGESFAKLRKAAIARGERVPLPILSAIVIGALRGLHAAHEATSAKGAPLEIVHRDVSPQNILVGVDGVPRVLDFGIARAAEGREAETLVRGDLKGKLAYMAPEQLSGEQIDRRCDLFAAGVVLWETLAQERLFREGDAVATMDAIFHREVPPLAGRAPGVTEELDGVIARALAKNAEDRFTNAEEMALALGRAVAPSSEADVGAWVRRIAGPALEHRAFRIAAFEQQERAAPGSETRIVRAPASEPPDVSTLENPTVADAGFEPVTEKRRSPVAPAPPAPERDLPTPATTRHAPRTPVLSQPPLTPIPAPVLTPLAMAMPTPSLDHVDESPSATRFAPVEHLHALRMSAPVPIPVPLKRARTRTQKTATIALLAGPPAAAAVLVAVLLATTSRSPTRGDSPTLAAPPAEAVALPEPAPVAAPAVVAAPVVAAPPPAPPTTVAQDGRAAGKARRHAPPVHRAIKR